MVAQSDIGYPKLLRQFLPTSRVVLRPRMILQVLQIPRERRRISLGIFSNGHVAVAHVNTTSNVRFYQGGSYLLFHSSRA